MQDNVCQHNQKRYCQKCRQEERGAILVLFAIFAVVCIAIAGLVVATGVLTLTKGQLQQAANTAALRCIQTFTETAGESYSVRAAKALENANINLEQNTSRLLGFGSKLSLEKVRTQASDATSGWIELGMWYPQRPNQQSNPCNNNYPCFIPNRSDLTVDAQANACRVQAKNKPNNPLTYPFQGLLKSSDAQTASAFATVIPRCTAYLIDVSGSVALETHQKIQQKRLGDASLGEPVVVVTNPIEPLSGVSLAALPAYRSRMLLDSDALTAQGVSILDLEGMSYSEISALGLFRNCQDPAQYESEEFTYWCNMPDTRPAPPSSDPAYRDDLHYKSDYSLRRSQAADGQAVFIDNFLFDSTSLNEYMGPQPLTRFFLSFHSGLRILSEQGSPNDRAAIISFTGFVRDQMPQQRYQGEDTTNDLGILLQLSNLYNRGMQDWQESPIFLGGAHQVHPNFLDRGWFPLLTGAPAYAATNIVEALQKSISVLSSSCPLHSQKSIVLASDGISSCAAHTNPWAPFVYGKPLCEKDPDPIFSLLYPDISSDYDIYQLAEQQLLDNDDPQSILNSLRDNKIALTVLLDGEYVRPNFINRVFDGRFLDPEEASALGYGAQGGEENFFDSTSFTPSGSSANVDSNDDREAIEEEAFHHAGQDGYTFGRASAVLGELAFKSGGLYCPLLPECDPSASTGALDAPNTSCPSGGRSTTNPCYEDHDSNPLTPERLKSAARVEGATQTCATVRKSKTLQAVDCVIANVTGNPYLLVDKWNKRFAETVIEP